MSGVRSVTRRGFLGIGLGAAAACGLAACDKGGAGALGGSGGSLPTITVPTAQSPWLDSYQKIIALYQQETGNRVNLRVFPFAGLLTQQTEAVQNKSLVFDVFQVNESWTGVFYDRGWVIPLREVDPSFSWDPQLIEFAGVGRWDKVARDTSLSGEPMALPFNGNMQLDNYRKDVLDKIGAQPPKTWDDVLAVGKAAKKAGVVAYGYAIQGQADIGGSSNTWAFNNILAAYGGDWFVNPGKDWTPRVNDEHAQAAMEMWLTLAKLGPAKAQTIGQAELFGLMAGGQLLQTQLVDSFCSQLDDPSQSKVVNMVDYTPTPSGPVGHPTPLSGTWEMGIPPGLPKDRQKAAYTFIQWLTSKRVQTMWAQQGFVPSRKDVYAELADNSKNRWMKSVSESFDNLIPGIRYPFAADMLLVTERRISDIVSGSLSVNQGLNTMASEIGQVAAAAGFK